MKNTKISIGVLGLWHLGCVYAVSLASKGYDVTGFDFDKKVIANLKKNIPPIFEPDLEKKLKNLNNKNLFFSSLEKEFFKDKDYIFITYDVPVDANDRVQLDIIDKTFLQISKNLGTETKIVISSQVPVGTSNKLVNLLAKNNKKNPVIYLPENLRLGQAFDSFLNPERIVLGSDSKDFLEKFKKDFSFFKCPFITMNLESAEMVKHALNTYLATCISFSSELSDISEKVGASMLDIIKAIKTDKRVSQFAPINPGLGFAGGTLGRDIQTLKSISKRYKYIPELMKAIYKINQDRIPMLISKIRSVFPSLKGKKMGILGLTYKPNTNTLRRSMSLDLISQLKKYGCEIIAFDPAIKDSIKNYPYIKIRKNIKSFFRDLDMMILMTEWPEFSNITPESASVMKTKFIIDTKNFLDKQKFESSGFKILRTGEGI